MSSLTLGPCGIYCLRGGRADDFCRIKIAARKLVSLKKKTDAIRIGTDSLGTSTVWTRAIAMLLLISFCASSLPIPIQSFESLRIDSSESYPCKGGACGCKSAHQCWTRCCCNSPAKRAAWAKKNGVTPPSYAILEEPTKVNHQSIAALRKKISSNVPGDSCCGASNKKDKEASLLASCTSKTKAPVVHRKTNKNLVLTMLALKCQGKDSVFTHLPWMALSIAQPAVALEDVRVVFDRPRASVLTSVSLDLDPPPPKATFA